MNRHPAQGRRGLSRDRRYTLRVLTRVVGEAIIIGDNNRLKVLSVTGNQVRLGIAAPRAVEVHRAEIYKRIRRARAQAAASRL